MPRTQARHRRSAGPASNSSAGLRLRLEAAGRLVAPGRRNRRPPAGLAAQRILGGPTGIAHDLFAPDDPLDLIGGKRLELEQPLGERMQLVEMLRQNLARLAFTILDDAADFL